MSKETKEYYLVLNLTEETWDKLNEEADKEELTVESIVEDLVSNL